MAIIRQQQTNIGIGSGSYWTGSSGTITRDSNVQISGSLLMSGSLGIGTTPTNIIDIYKPGNHAKIRMITNATTYSSSIQLGTISDREHEIASYYDTVQNNYVLDFNTNNQYLKAIRFKWTGSESMRITPDNVDISGSLYVTGSSFLKSPIYVGNIDRYFVLYNTNIISQSMVVFGTGSLYPGQIDIRDNWDGTVAGFNYDYKNLTLQNDKIEMGVYTGGGLVYGPVFQVDENGNVTYVPTGSIEFLRTTKIGTQAGYSSIQIFNDTTVTGSFVVSGSSRITGSLIITGSARITGSLYGSSTGSFKYLEILGDTITTKNIISQNNLQSSGSTLITGSLTVSGNVNITGSLTMSGDLIVDGIVVAQEFHTEYVSASIIYSSGSTKFGDSSNDTHEFTGSILVWQDGLGGTSIQIGSAGASYGKIYYDAVSDSTLRGLYIQSPDVSSRGVFIDLVRTSNYFGIRSTTDNRVFTVNDSGFTTISGSSKHGNIATDIHEFTGSVKITGNVGIGTTEPTEKLHVVGNISSSNFITSGTSTWVGTSITQTGSYQTMVGYRAGTSNVANQSTNIGTDAGNANTGLIQTTLGYGAGQKNSGNYQTAVGYLAGYLNTGSGEVAIGHQAGAYNTQTNLTALGYFAGQVNIGSNATFVGANAGIKNTGSYAIGIGVNATRENASDYVIGIGLEAAYLNTGANIIGIGYRAGYLNTTANQFILQQTNVNATPLIQGDFSTGQVGIGTTIPSASLHVTGSTIFGGNVDANIHHITGSTYQTGTILLNGKININTTATSASYKIHAYDDSGADVLMYFDSKAGNARFNVAADTSLKVPTLVLYDRTVAGTWSPNNAYWIGLDRFPSPVYASRNDAVYVNNFADKGHYFLTKTGGTTGIRLIISGTGELILSGSSQFGSNPGFHLHRFTGSIQQTGSGTATSFIDNFQISGTLNVSGTTTITGYSASTTVFKVEGTSGSLFEVSDELSGSLFSVNDISGLTILEVFSDDKVVAGKFNTNTFVVTGSRVGIGLAAPTVLFDVSGSTHFGSSLSDTHIFTGSIYQTGSGGTSRFTDTVHITGSLIAGNITGSLYGTASWTLNSVQTVRANIPFIIRGTITNFISPSILLPDNSASVYEVRAKTTSGSLSLDVRVDATPFVSELVVSSASWSTIVCSQSLVLNDEINIYVYNAASAEDLSVNIFISKSLI